MKNCKKALDVCKKSLTHKSSFSRNCKKALDVCKKSRTQPSARRRLVQVADYKDFRKPYKTYVKSIILVFWEAQNVRICKKALYVCKKLRAHKSSFWSLQEVVQVADYKNSENLIKPV